METKASRRHSEADMEALRMAAHHSKQTMKALRMVGYDGMKPKSIKALDESVTLTERQVAMYDTYEALVDEYGVFNQGIGANGAHYGAADANPFKDEGIVCKSCVFFMAGKCEIVEGDIEEEGICKLWIIPESALNLVAPEEEAMVEEMDAEDMVEEMAEEAEAMVEEPVEEVASMQEMDDEDKALDNTATINKEAVKRFARRLLGVK